MKRPILNREIIHSRWAGYLGLLLAGIPALYPLFQSGLILTHDQYFPIHRLVAMYDALSQGQFPPRWTDYFGLGYGYPLFNFYAPLAYYIASFVYYLTNHPVFSVHFVFGMGLLAGGLGCYYWLKQEFRDCWAWIGGLLYIYYPYHFVNAYVRGDVSELLASAWFPWLMGALSRIEQGTGNPKFRWIIAGLFYALLMLSHNIMALLFTGVLSVYILFALYKTCEKKRFLLECSSAILLGMGLSGYFWLPAFLEKKYVHVDWLLKEADFHQHFVYGWQLLSSRWGYGGSVPGPGDGMSFQLGWVVSILAIFSLFISRSMKSSPRRKSILFNAGILAAMIVLMLPVSVLCWEHIPLLRYALFPWRWLSLTAVPLVFLSGAALNHLGEHYFHRDLAKRCFLFLVIITVLFAIPWLNPRTTPVNPELIQKQVIWRIEKYSHNYGTTMSNEYLPVTVHRMPEFPPVDLLVTSEGRVDYHPLQYSNVERILETNLNHAQTVNIPVFYFPGWKLTLDEIPLSYTLSEEGTFLAEIPPGGHRLALRFQDTPVRAASEWLSLATLLLLIAYIIIVRMFPLKRYFS